MINEVAGDIKAILLNLLDIRKHWTRCGRGEKKKKGHFGGGINVTMETPVNNLRKSFVCFVPEMKENEKKKKINSHV